MTCPTCRAAAQLSDNAASTCLVDVKCPQCCVRHLMQTIGHLGSWGDAGHERRIRQLLAERLAEDKE